MKRNAASKKQDKTESLLQEVTRKFGETPTISQPAQGRWSAQLGNWHYHEGRRGIGNRHFGAGNSIVGALKKLLKPSRGITVHEESHCGPGCKKYDAVLACM